MNTACNNNLCASTDMFSWRRTKLYAEYLYPRMRTLLLVYLCISLALTALGVVASRFTFVYGITEWALMLMTVFAPLALHREGSRGIDIGVPALWSEKAAVTLFFTIVLVPLSVWALPTIAMLIFKNYSLSSVIMSSFDKASIPIYPSELSLLTRLDCLNNWLCSIGPAALCTLFVVGFKKNVMSRTIVWMLACGVFVMLCGGISAGGYVAFSLIENMKGEASPAEIDAFMDSLMPGFLQRMIWIAFGLYLLMTVVCSALVCNKIKRRTV